MILSTEEPPASRRSRFRFSLAGLLAAITIVAILAAAWQAFVHKHPTYYLGLYEKAPSTRTGSIAVGPNRIEIAYIARNDRNGDVTYEDGLGAAIKVASPYAKQLKQVGAWLDVVEVELGPAANLVDIIDFRAFDHATRDILFASDGYGWKLAAPNVVQIYGIKKKLPPKLDLWFRAHSYDAGAPRFKLPASVGAACQLPSGTVTLNDIRTGQWSSRNYVLQQPPDVGAPMTTAAITWDVAPTGDDYQIAAITADGDRFHTETSHLISFRSGLNQAEMIQFGVPLAEIDHLELQPFGGRHTFFFDGVSLPTLSATPLASPPVVAVPVNGQEIDRVVTDFAPIDLTVAVHRGMWAEGTSAGERLAWVTPRSGGPLDTDKASCISYALGGLGAQLGVRIIGALTSEPFDEKNQETYSSGRTSSGTAAAGYQTNYIPLDRIKAIEIKLEP